MAPSRALRRAVSASIRCSQAPRLSSACRARILAIARPSSICVSTSPLRSPLRNAAASIASSRFMSSEARSSGVEPPEYLNEAELHIFNKLKAELDPVNLEVQDISGGCGSMYAISIDSARFKGLPVVKQHKLVNQVLADEIKGWHGVQLRTKAI